MFNLKEFVLSNLINGVKKNSFSKEYASILATNYLLKGILNEEDIQIFDEETTDQTATNEEENVALDTEVESTENLETKEESEEA